MRNTLRTGLEHVRRQLEVKKALKRAGGDTQGIEIRLKKGDKIWLVIYLTVLGVVLVKYLIGPTVSMFGRGLSLNRVLVVATAVFAVPAFSKTSKTNEMTLSFRMACSEAALPKACRIDTKVFDVDLVAVLFVKVNLRGRNQGPGAVSRTIENHLDIGKRVILRACSASHLVKIHFALYPPNLFGLSILGFRARTTSYRAVQFTLSHQLHESKLLRVELFLGQTNFTRNGICHATSMKLVVLF